MSGAARASTMTGRASPSVKASATACAAEPTMQAGASAATAAASRKLASRGVLNCAAARAEDLQVDVGMPGVDGGDHWKAVVSRQVRSGKNRQRREANGRLVGRQRNAARGGKTDAQAGKAAGAGGHGDTINGGEPHARFVHHPFHQRHQRFGMAARSSAGSRSQQCRRARCRAPPQRKPPAPCQSPIRAWMVTGGRPAELAKSAIASHIGRTSVTSGTK